MNDLKLNFFFFASPDAPVCCTDNTHGKRSDITIIILSSNYSSSFFSGNVKAPFPSAATRLTLARESWIFDEWDGVSIIANLISEDLDILFLNRLPALFENVTSVILSYKPILKLKDPSSNSNGGGFLNFISDAVDSITQCQCCSRLLQVRMKIPTTYKSSQTRLLTTSQGTKAGWAG